MSQRDAVRQLTRHHMVIDDWRLRRRARWTESSVPLDGLEAGAPRQLGITVNGEPVPLLWPLSAPSIRLRLINQPTARV